MDVLSGVRGFVAVARRRSFSAAAVAEGTTQPVMSRRVAALEQRLGGPLFDRTSRHVQLTPLGVAVLGHARELLSAEESFREAAAAHQQGSLRLLVPPDLDPAAWAAVMLQGRASGHNLQVDEAARDHRAARLLAGEVDLAVTAVDSARADWVVELGLAHHHDDAGAAVRLLRPVRADRDRRARLLILAEDASPGLLRMIRAATVRLGLGAGQVQPAASTVTALAEVIAGDARLLCAKVQSRCWGLGWQPATELRVRRHYRLEDGRSSVASTLLPVIREPIGRALGVQAAE